MLLNGIVRHLVIDDVKRAFIQADMDYDAYMSGEIVKLNKAVYGLK